MPMGVYENGGRGLGPIAIYDIDEIYRTDSAVVLLLGQACSSVVEGVLAVDEEKTTRPPPTYEQKSFCTPIAGGYTLEDKSCLHFSADFPLVVVVFNTRRDLIPGFASTPAPYSR